MRLQKQQQYFLFIPAKLGQYISHRRSRFTTRNCCLHPFSHCSVQSTSQPQAASPALPAAPHPVATSTAGARRKAITPGAINPPARLYSLEPVCPLLHISQPFHTRPSGGPTAPSCPSEACSRWASAQQPCVRGLESRGWEQGRYTKSSICSPK